MSGAGAAGFERTEASSDDDFAGLDVADEDDVE
jgi:hypothetical protein